MNPEEIAMTERQKKPYSVMFYVVIAAVLYVVIQAHALLAPIILSFLLILLITLAVNPIILRLRTWAGGRKRATGFVMVVLLTLCGLTIWAAAYPMKQAAATLSERLPDYWERLQKPLIKMEQKSEISEVKLQEEVSKEIASETSDGGEGKVESMRVVSVPSPKSNSSQGKEKESLRSNLSEMIDGLFGQVNNMAHNTTEMLVVLVTVFFGVIFTLMNPRPIFGALFSVVPERHHVKG